jgi:8-hydroxy-5-deazaflavin:NADPH oxidoreductase
MKIAIIGAGRLGTALAKRLGAAGHAVTLTFSLDVKQLADTAASLGVRAAGPADAVRDADVVVFATNWSAAKDAFAAVGSLEGRLVWDCMVPVTGDLKGLTIGHDTSAGEEVTRLAKGARVVKAIPPPAELLHAAPAAAAARRPTVFLCGEDADAKRVIGDLVTAIGSDPVDAGAITSARYTEPLVMLLIHLGYGIGNGGQIGMAFLKYT